MNLGNVYFDQARYDEAESLYKRSLAIAEAAGGPDHPTVALSLLNLARVYQDRNRYALAEPLLKRSLAIQERLYGPEHPEVADPSTTWPCSISTKAGCTTPRRCLNVRWRFGARHCPKTILNSR